MVGFDDVTDNVFRETLAPRNIETMSALDGDRVPTPSARQTAISARCARLLWPDARAISDSYPELQLNPGFTIFQLLTFVITAINKFTQISVRDQPIFMQQVIEFDRKLASFINEGEYERTLQEIAAFDNPSTMTLIAESFNSNPDIDLDALRGYHEAGKQAIAARQDAIEHWGSFDPQLYTALASYIRIDRNVLDTLRQRSIVLKEVLDRVQ